MLAAPGRMNWKYTAARQAMGDIAGSLCRRPMSWLSKRLNWFSQMTYGSLARCCITRFSTSCPVMAYFTARSSGDRAMKWSVWPRKERMGRPQP